MKALYQRLAALEEGKDRFRATRDWIKVQEWDKVDADLKSQEAKLKKKEADLFANSKNQHL